MVSNSRCSVPQSCEKLNPSARPSQPPWIHQVCGSEGWTLVRDGDQDSHPGPASTRNPQQTSTGSTFLSLRLIAPSVRTHISNLPLPLAAQTYPVTPPPQPCECCVRRANLAPHSITHPAAGILVKSREVQQRMARSFLLRVRVRVSEWRIRRGARDTDT